jgi:hypothetical protein
MIARDEHGDKRLMIQLNVDATTPSRTLAAIHRANSAVLIAAFKLIDCSVDCVASVATEVYAPVPPERDQDTMVLNGFLPQSFLQDPFDPSELSPEDYFLYYIPFEFHNWLKD